MSRIGRLTALALAALVALGGWFALPVLLGAAVSKFWSVAARVVSFPIPWAAVRYLGTGQSYMLYGLVISNGLFWGFVLAWVATKIGILPSWEEYDYLEDLEDEEFEEYDGELESAWQTWSRRAALPAALLLIPLAGYAIDRECFGLYDYVRMHFRAPDATFSRADAERLSKMHNLRDLDLSGTRIDDEGLRHIRNLSRLEKLDLSNTPVNGRLLDQLHGMNRLAELDLTDSSVGNTGMEHLSTIPSLEKLLAGGTNVSDRGVHSIATLPKLTVLSLRGTRITDEALDALDENRILRVLDLRDTNLKPARVKAFRGRHSDCRVEFP